MSLRAAAAIAVTIGLGTAAANANAAEAEVSFRGKTITMIIGSSPGGGTDATGRVIANFLRKYLPGEPNIVVQNMSGAAGIPSLNYIVKKAQADGLYVSMVSQSVIDPSIYRFSPNVQYDPKKLLVVGGVRRGGAVVFIRSDARAGLLDTSKPKLIVGNVEAVPRADMQPILWAIEYLGWNAKWVTGYAGTNDVMIAFDRGEVELTATSNIFQIQDRLKSGSLTLLTQTGMVKDGAVVGRPEFGDTPLFIKQMEGKVSDSVAQRAFEYSIALNSTDKFLALAPGTPPDILQAYRDAFAKASEDPRLVEMGAKVSDGFAPVSGEEFESALNVLVDTPPAALDYLKSLMRKQGLRAH